DLWEDAKDLKFYPPAVMAKERLSMLAPDAVGVKHTLSGGTGSLLDKHGIDQAIQCIENEKNDLFLINFLYCENENLRPTPV
ncbi:hypothetical protein ACJ8HD_16240, partial [Serratia sp. CY39337]